MSQKEVYTSNQNNNFEVFVRIRPNNEYELSQASCVNILSQKEIQICQNQKGQSTTFSFDHIFDLNSTQEKIYNRVTNDIIENAFEGINGTILCYGQTCSGKTYTCVGNNLEDEKQKGLVSRIIQQILQKTEGCPKHISLKTKISIVQIYNEKIKDLLDQSKTNIRIRSDKSRGIFLQNVTQKYILSKEEAKHYISKGTQKRTIGITGMNSFSSRSHLLFIITVHQHNLYTGEAKKAKITLVDLAGSEKLSRAGSEGKILQQTKKINTSLSTLGKVINILSDGRNSHVPYRDSKLTRLLQQSLGGNSLTKLVVNISGAKINYNETLNSLRFGIRAKGVKNQPTINKQYTVPELLQILHKADRKIKILTQVIKQIMKQKGNQTISFKQFVKMYLLDSPNGYQSNQSDQDIPPVQICKSISNRASFLLDQTDYKPASVRSNGSGLKSYHKRVQNQNFITIKPKIQSAISPQKALKVHKSTSKPIKSKIKIMEMTPKVMTKLKCQRVKSLRKEYEFMSQRDIKIKQDDRYSISEQRVKKNEQQNRKIRDIVSCKQFGGSVHSINSRVIDINIKNSMNREIKKIKLQLGEVLSDDNNHYSQNSIEFNILKIKQNFKKIENLKLQALIS